AGRLAFLKENLAISAEVTSINHQTINIDSHEKTISARISRSDASRYPGRESCTKRLDFTVLLRRNDRRNGTRPLRGQSVSKQCLPHVSWCSYRNYRSPIRCHQHRGSKHARVD